MTARGGMSGPRRRRAHRAGRRAEALAALWLRLKGYRLLARNFRTRHGEADLILARAGTLVVVEVKYRPGSAAAARLAVTPRARERIARAAAAFQAGRGERADEPVRFDLVAVTGGWPPIHHVRDAWRP